MVVRFVHGIARRFELPDCGSWNAECELAWFTTCPSPPCNTTAYINFVIPLFRPSCPYGRGHKFRPQLNIDVWDLTHTVSVNTHPELCCEWKFTWQPHIAQQVQQNGPPNLSVPPTISLYFPHFCLCSPGCTTCCVTTNLWTVEEKRNGSVTLPGNRDVKFKSTHFVAVEIVTHHHSKKTKTKLVM